MVLGKWPEVNLLFYNDNLYPIYNNFNNLFMTIFTYCFYNVKYKLTHCYLLMSVLALTILGSFNIWPCMIISFSTLKITLIECKIYVFVTEAPSSFGENLYNFFSEEGGRLGVGGRRGVSLVCWVFSLWSVNCCFLKKLIQQLHNNVNIILNTNILTSDIFNFWIFAMYQISQ